MGRVRVARTEGNEKLLSWLFFVFFTVLATAHYAAKTVRQATYIDVFGADKLPWVYLLVALISFPVLVIYSRLTERVAHGRLIVMSCFAQALGLVLFYWLYGLDQPWVAMAFYASMTLSFGIAISQLWTLAQDVFDSRQARRLFAFIGAGGLLGGVPGGQLARWAAATSGTRYTLLWAAGLMLIAGGIVSLIQIYRPAKPESAIKEPSTRNLEAAQSGFAMLRSSRLLVSITLLMVLTVVVAQMVDLQFFWMLEHHTEGLDQRTEVIGLFFSAMGIAAFLFQILFTRRIHRWLGVELGMRVLPASVAVLGLLVVLTIGFMPAAAFAIVWVLKLAETGFRHSVDQSTRELLFMPVFEHVRRRAKAFIDVFVQRAAKGVAAVFLLPVTFGLISMTHLGFAIVFWSLVWFALTWIVRREYVNAFREGLASGVIQEPAVIDPGDLMTVTTLVESLASSEPRQVVHGLELLAANGHASLVPPLLLHHKDAEVRRKTLEVLGASGRYDAAPLVEERVSDDDPLVRRGAMQTLATLRGLEVTHIMLSRLDDPDPALRAAAAASLVSSNVEELAGRADAQLAEMATAADAGIRKKVASALGNVKEPTLCATLVNLLYDPDRFVVREAILAVRQRMERDGLSPIYVPILISLTRNRRLKHDAREALVACGPGAVASMTMFMCSVDEQIWVRRAVPKTIAKVGTQQAVDTLVDALGGGDELLRIKIIDALVYLRQHSPDLHMPQEAIRRQIRLEMQRYLGVLADLWALSQDNEPVLEGPLALWVDKERPPSLLQQLLGLRVSESVNSLFGLLILINRPEDVRAAQRSLLSGNAALRARALEYLDNTLRGGLKRDVLAVIDDVSITDRLARLQSGSGISKLSEKQTLRKLLHADFVADPSALMLGAAAAYFVHTEGIDALIPDLENLVEQDEHEHEFLVETAGWVCRQRICSGKVKGGVMMAAMARIEMVVFMQKVDLFSSCSAEQVVRLASIASERKCTEGEVIFRRDEGSHALFCVVEGGVILRGQDRDDEHIGSGGHFGVVDILSGEKRTLDAVSLDGDTRLLMIEAEDFFDLLSNNIEIVKALFRQVICR